MARRWEVLAEELALECAHRSPGDSLPSQRELMAAGRGSQATINQAYEELVRRGLVRGKTGAVYIVLPRRTGTVRLVRTVAPIHPAPAKAWPLWELPGRSVLLSREVVEPPASIAIKLGLGEDDLLVLRTVHEARRGQDEGALALQRVWQTDRTGAAVATGGYAREQIRYRKATAQEAEALGLPYDGPVVVVESVLRNAASDAAEVRQIVAPAAHTELITEDPLPDEGRQAT